MVCPSCCIDSLHRLPTRTLCRDGVAKPGECLSDHDKIVLGHVISDYRVAHWPGRYGWLLGWLPFRGGSTAQEASGVGRIEVEDATRGSPFPRLRDAL